jgi:DNA-binding transcriptional LysR family regulator
MPISLRLCSSVMSVEARHLRCFLAIAEHGNVTRAAAALHVTQPALSRTLRQLEEHLGVRLIERSTHHLELTPAGVAYQARAAAAVAAMDSALDPAGLATWPLRVGHAWSALGRFTTPLLRRWEATYPDVPLELLRFDDRLAGLSRGEVAVAILRDPDSTESMQTSLLFREPRVAGLPADSPLAAADRLSLHDLVDQTIATNHISGTTSLSMWPVEARPSRTVDTTNTDDWLAAIASGRSVGVTTASTSYIHPYPGVVYVPLVDAPEVSVLLAWTVPLVHPGIPDFVAVARAVVAETL